MRNLLRFNIGSVIRRVLGRQRGAQIEPQQLADNIEEKETKIVPSSLDTGAATNLEINNEPLHLLVWTVERDRYGVRGRALCTTVEVHEGDAVYLCQGVQGYVLNSPNGETVVIEARTGGLVGYTLETVLDGIRDMPISELVKQIDSGKKEFDRMRQLELSNAMFWRALKMSDEDQSSIAEYD
jgi:hypothetical protein